ncbi:MAG TPA: hypothetical protein VGE21_02600 [Flavobacteriales bacterium]
MSNSIKAWGAVLLWTSTAFTAVAQNEEDALRYSSTLPGGTARSWGMGSAMGAVGADPISASLNPAGFGLYNTSELSFTPAFEVNDAKSIFSSTRAQEQDQRFHFNNFALMLHHEGEKGSDWRGGTFGVSFDRQASFHWDTRAVGERVNSTVLQQFANEAYGFSGADLADQFPFTADLAYQTYGIDPNVDTTQLDYTTAIPFGSPTRQQHTVTAGGRLNTTSIFYGTNYLDKLYLGLSIGLVSTRYERNTKHKENTLDPAVDLQELTFEERLLTTGNGVDVKFGLIGRVTERLRLGGSFHSPMWLQLSDAYSYSMSTRFSTSVDGQNSYSATSPDGTFSYRVRTPWRALGSVAYVVGKHGVISADYQYADQRGSKLNAARDIIDGYDFEAENEVIKDSFRGTHSIRVGTEWRSGNWYFRAGWGVWPDAYADNDSRQGTAYKRYTGGIGFRTDRVSIDLAGVYGQRDVVTYPYDPALVSAITQTLTDTRGMLTIAFRP